MNSHMRALIELGTTEVAAIIAIADTTIYIGRIGAIGDNKMVVTIEGIDNMLVMDDITNQELMAITAINFIDESEMDGIQLGRAWKVLEGIRRRIPKGFEMFAPFP